MAKNVDVAFGKALDYVKAHVTPTDGGEVEAVVEKLRQLSADPNFMKSFAASVEPKKKENEDV